MGRDAAEGFAPVLHLIDLPRFEAGEAESFARAAAFADPWRPMLLSSSASHEGYAPRVGLDQPARMGVLAEALPGGVSGRFDHGHALVADIHFGSLASAPAPAVLNGENRLAVRSAAGGWEVLSYLYAEEISAGRWRLTGLLRGLAGTEDQMRAGSIAGAAIVHLDAAVVPLGLAVDAAGQAFNWIAETPGRRPYGPVVFTGGLRAAMPLAPVHLSARKTAGGDVQLRWIRRSRIDADHWLGGDIPLDEPVEAYRVEILDGPEAVRTMEVTQTSCLYASSMMLADFGGPVSSLAFRVRQKGGKVPLGLAAETSIPL